MAKKSAKAASGREVNKSAAIRDYMEKYPEAGPTEIAKALNESENLDISAAYVSTIKNKVKGPASGRRGRRGRRRGAVRSVRSSSAGPVNEQALLQAKKLALQVGGIDEAKAALELLGRLTS